MPCRSSLSRLYPHKVFQMSCACATLLLDSQRHCTCQPVDNMYADQPPCMIASLCPVRRTWCSRYLCAPSRAGSATCRKSWPAGSMYHHPQQYTCRSCCCSSGHQPRPRARSPRDSDDSRMSLLLRSTHRQLFASNPRQHTECVWHHA